MPYLEVDEPLPNGLGIVVDAALVAAHQPPLQNSLRAVKTQHQLGEGG